MTRKLAYLTTAGMLHRIVLHKQMARVNYTLAKLAAKRRQAQ